jgi:hypothetical protein
MTEFDSDRPSTLYRSSRMRAGKFARRAQRYPLLHRGLGVLSAYNQTKE